jgi:hypothetical protein
MAGTRMYRREDRLQRHTDRMQRIEQLHRCDRSGKLTFRSRAAAKREARAIQGRGHHQGELMDVYVCRWCGEWHLTTRLPSKATA